MGAAVGSDKFSPNTPKLLNDVITPPNTLLILLSQALVWDENKWG